MTFPLFSQDAIFFSPGPADELVSRHLSLLSLFPPAGATANGAGVNKALGDLVPPFLLRAGPNFRAAAVGTAKRNIDVVSPSDEIGSAVTIVRREQLLIDRYHSIRRRFGGCRIGRPPAFSSALLSSLYDFHASLLAALHRKFVDLPAMPIISFSLAITRLDIGHLSIAAAR